MIGNTDLYYLGIGYLMLPVTIFVFIKISRTSPQCENSLNTNLSVRNMQDLYAKYIPKVICPYCKSLKAKSSYHCMVCNCCVKEFDHHCTWINNCIGKGNLKLFLLTLVFFILDFAYTMVISVIFIQYHTGIAWQIATNMLVILSTLLLIFVSPFYYLFLSNFLNSTTVHKQFSRKSALNSVKSIDNLGQSSSLLISEDQFNNIPDLEFERSSSEISQMRSNPSK